MVSWWQDPLFAVLVLCTLCAFYVWVRRPRFHGAIEPGTIEYLNEGEDLVRLPKGLSGEDITKALSETGI